MTSAPVSFSQSGTVRVNGQPVGTWTRETSPTRAWIKWWVFEAFDGRNSVAATRKGLVTAAREARARQLVTEGAGS